MNSIFNRKVFRNARVKEFSQDHKASLSCQRDFRDSSSRNQELIVLYKPELNERNKMHVMCDFTNKYKYQKNA